MGSKVGVQREQSQHSEQDALISDSARNLEKGGFIVGKPWFQTAAPLGQRYKGGTVGKNLLQSFYKVQFDNREHGFKKLFIDVSSKSYSKAIL